MRSAGQFSKITVFTGSTPNESLDNDLYECSDKSEMYNKMDKMPDLEEFEGENMCKSQKL
jgi:hypothetical protein